MRKLSLISMFTLLFAAIAPLAPSYSQTGLVHVSFLVRDSVSGSNVGDHANVVMFQVNRNDVQQKQTDLNGVVSFDIQPVSYILSFQCNNCQNPGYRSNGQGVQYLVTPQSDGAILMQSASDVPVDKDANGNFIIFTASKRIADSNDPWTSLKSYPNSEGSPEHVYLLSDASVLVQTRAQSGKDSWFILTPDQMGSYENGSWRSIAQPPASYNPQNMNGALLHSGKFIIVGGEQNTNADGKMEDNTNQIYTYDPITDSWTAVPAPNNGQGDWATIGAAPFSQLADGRIVVGRNGSQNKAGLPAMAYDEKTSSWTLVGTNKFSSNNEEGYSLLSNGKLLSIYNGDNPNDREYGSAELFDPATGLWSLAAKTPYPLGHSEIGPAIALPNGKALAMGATGKNLLYDVNTNSWTPVPDFPKLKNGLQETASDNQAAVLPNGNVLVSTSVFTCSTNNCFWVAPALWYEYDWKSNSWLNVSDDPSHSSASITANGTSILALPNGQTMVVESGGVIFYNSKGSPDESWRPIVDQLSSTDLSPGATYSVSGKQLAGLTPGSAWGDEQENASNFGLVRITNMQSHHIFYARAFDYSSTSIAPMAPSKFSFSINANTENGPSTVEVIANGISSTPMKVNISGGIDLPTPKPVVTATPSPTSTPIPISSPTPTPSPTVSATKTKILAKKSITCIKGKSVSKVVGINPKCPSGYKIKP
jgi:hypothetical protein